MRKHKLIALAIMVTIMAMGSIGVYADAPQTTEAEMVLKTIEQISLSSDITAKDDVIEALESKGIEAQANSFAYVSNFSDLKAALADSDVSIILLLNDIQMEAPLIIDRDLSMSGILGATITSAPETDLRHFIIINEDDRVTLMFSNVTLDGGNISGGINTRAQSHIKGAVIQNCLTTEDGGAISASLNEPVSGVAATSFKKSSEDELVAADSASYASESAVLETDLILEDCRIVNNTAAYYGGGFYGLSGTAPVLSSTLINCEFTGNQAMYGGAVYCANLYAENTIVHNNTATMGGGGLNVGLQYLTLKDCKITSNTASSGAGLQISASIAEVNLEGTEISFNAAREIGGGLYGYTIDANTVIRGGVFEGNTASSLGGGAIYMDYWNNNGGTVLTGTIIKDNHAPNGGAVAVRINANSTIPALNRLYVEEDVIFSGNTADEGYYMTDPADIALHEANIHTTHFSEPFTQYAYNNFDIAYTEGDKLETISVNFYLHYSDTDANETVALYAGQVLGDKLPEGPAQAGLHFLGWTDAKGAFYYANTIITESVNLYPAYLLQ